MNLHVLSCIQLQSLLLDRLCPLCGLDTRVLVSRYVISVRQLVKDSYCATAYGGVRVFRDLYIGFSSSWLKSRNLLDRLCPLCGLDTKILVSRY